MVSVAITLLGSVLITILGGIFLKIASSKNLKPLRRWLTLFGVVNVVLGVFFLFGVVLFLLIQFLQSVKTH